MRFVGLMGLSLFLSLSAHAEGEFGIKFFGEDPKQEFTPTPDSGDASESWSRHGEHRKDGEPEGPVETPAPAKAEPKKDETSSALIQSVWPAGKPAAYGEAEAVEIVPRRWPGPRRPPPKIETAKSDGPEKPKDDLRDALAPAAAGRYSLWSNLSTPLLLPASRVADVPAGDAKALGAADYDRSILGLRAAAVSAVAPVGREENPARLFKAAENRGMYVAVEFIVKDFKRDYPGMMADFVRQSGFELNASVPPEQVGAPGSGRVVVRGWLLPSRMGEAASVAGVSRVEGAAPAAEPERADLSRTDILVGIRIPPESSPTEALREAALRLALSSEFELGRAIGYQRIPGTSRMVLVVSGTVPVRRLAKLLSDPSVVKTAPLPKEQPAVRRASAGPESLVRRMARYGKDNPVVLLVALLLVTIAMLQTPGRTRRRTRP